MKECDYCDHVEMCAWRKGLNDDGCEFYSGGDQWILVSERLPYEDERIKSYVRAEYASEFIVMIEGATNPTTLYLTMDNYWKDDYGNFYTVIAWMPLPEPYKEIKRE